MHYHRVPVTGARLTLQIENLVAGGCQVTEVFCAEYVTARALSPRDTSNLGPSAYIAILVFREVRKMVCFPDTTFGRFWMKAARENCFAEVPRGAETSSSTKFYVNSSNHSGRSRPVLHCHTFSVQRLFSR